MLFFPKNSRFVNSKDARGMLRWGGSGGLVRFGTWEHVGGLRAARNNAGRASLFFPPICLGANDLGYDGDCA